MVVTHAKTGERVSVGVDLITVRRLRDVLEEFDVLQGAAAATAAAAADGDESRRASAGGSAVSAGASGARKPGDAVFDFVIVPLAHPRYERIFEMQRGAMAGTLSGSTRTNSGGGSVGGGSGTLAGLSRGVPTGSVRSSRAGSGGAREAAQQAIVRSDPFTRSDTELYTGEWMSAVLGKVSEWIRLDSIHDSVRSNAEEAFFQELAYAAHLSLRAAVVTAPIGGPSGGIANFGSCLNAALLRFPTLQIWLRLPVRVPDSFPSSRVKDGDTWELWNAVRCMCDSHPNLGVALEVGALLPAAPGVLERWTAEPLRLMLLSTAAFQMNRHSFPVLSKPHQAFVKAAFRYQPQLAICHRLPPKILETQTVTRGYRLYVDYIAHMFGKQPVPPADEQFCAKYQDVLMEPPQLLAPQPPRASMHVDAPRLVPALSVASLEYDTAKLEAYADALARCFVDRAPAAATTIKGGIVVLVLGGGRGAMLTTVLAAAKRPGAAKLAEVHVVDMNPMAVQTLRSRAARDPEWARVRVHQGRDWSAGRGVGRKQVDVCVTDLLGAFGDDALLPEWLETMTDAFKDDVVCIPSRVESYIAPLSGDVLYNALRNDTAATRTAAERPFDAPYVVCINRGSHVAPVQQCFTFALPAAIVGVAGEKPSFSQQRSLTFDVSEARVLHGFAGYYDAALYKDVTFSTRPETHPPAQGANRFALFFPVRLPIYLVRGTVCTFELWRRSEGPRVWYEWAVTAPELTPLHNVMGCAFSMTTRGFLPPTPSVW